MKARYYVLAYFLLFGTWVGIIWFNVQGAAPLIGYIQNTLAALTGHALTMINPKEVSSSSN